LQLNSGQYFEILSSTESIYFLSKKTWIKIAGRHLLQENEQKSDFSGWTFLGSDVDFSPRPVEKIFEELFSLSPLEN